MGVQESRGRARTMRSMLIWEIPAWSAATLGLMPEILRNVQVGRQLQWPSAGVSENLTTKHSRGVLGGIVGGNKVRAMSDPG
jgi:hypothetical protein